MEVADDGHGLLAARGDAAFGIRGMTERIASAGDTLTIGAREGGRRVAVRAVLPCKPEMAELP